METNPLRSGEQLYENVVKVRTKNKAQVNGVSKRKTVSVLTYDATRKPLTRDELAKYVDSPGWKLLRISLFILLWALIFGLTAGAIYLVAVDPSRTAANTFWWRHATFYQISVKSFQDSNSDGVGDLNGVLGRLDYIQSLGMQSIILNPIFASRSGNSFAVSDFTSIDRAVGTSEDFDALVKAIHERNMTIVMDVAVSQTDRDHQWFRTSEAYPRQGITPSTEYYVWNNGNWNSKRDHDGFTIPGFPSQLKTVPDGQPAWTWSDGRHQYYRHLYGSSTPDLNYGDLELRRAMDEVLRFWLRRGVDGFRFLRIKDMVSSAENAIAVSNSTTLHSETMDTIRRWRRVLDQPLDSPVYKKKVLMVQDEDLDRAQLHFAGVDHVMDASLLQVDSTTTGWHIAATVEKVLTHLPHRSTASWSFSDYNRHRAVSRVGSLDLVDGLNMICQLLPGTSVSLYGDEIGLKDGSSGLSLRREDANFLVRGPQLTPMPWTSDRLAGFTDYVAAWLPVQDNFRYTVQYQQRTSPSHLKVFQHLVALRASAAITAGLYRTAVITDTLYSFLRLNQDSSGYLVAVDLRKSGKEVIHYSFSSVNVGKNSRVVEVLFGSVNLYRSSGSSTLAAANATISLDGTIPLRPGEAVVLRIPAVLSL